MEKTSRILGIDPGTLYMGYALLDTTHVTTGVTGHAMTQRAGGGRCSVVTFDVLDVHKLDGQYARLQREFFFLQELIDTYHPTCLAIETQFVDKNPQTMIKIVHAQGVAIAAALSRDLPVYEYSPMRVKMAITGKGNTTKEGVAQMLQRMFGLSSFSLPKKLDATDALAIAYCHYLQQGRPQADEHGAKDWTTWAKQRGLTKK